MWTQKYNLRWCHQVSYEFHEYEYWTMLVIKKPTIPRSLLRDPWGYVPSLDKKREERDTKVQSGTSQVLRSAKVSCPGWRNIMSQPWMWWWGYTCACHPVCMGQTPSHTQLSGEDARFLVDRRRILKLGGPSLWWHRVAWIWVRSRCQLYCECMTTSS